MNTAIMKHATLALCITITLGQPASALSGEGAAIAMPGVVQIQAQPVEMIRDLALAAIAVAREAAQATNDTMHHNVNSMIGTAATARGFVRDSVGGVLGNARKITGMVGDVMPLTTHNHYQNAAQAKKDNKAK